MTTIATFTSNRGEFTFDPIAFGDTMIKAGLANKTQVRAMVSELRQFYQLQTVIVELAARGIDGFTVTDGIGYWKGTPELCIVVTVFADSDSLIVVCACATACTPDTLPILSHVKETTMYGIETIQSLNRKNQEAAAIMAKHEQKPATPHQPTLFAPVEKINEILEGAKG